MPVMETNYYNQAVEEVEQLLRLNDSGNHIKLQAIKDLNLNVEKFCPWPDPWASAA